MICTIRICIIQKRLPALDLSDARLGNKGTNFDTMAITIIPVQLIKQFMPFFLSYESYFNPNLCSEEDWNSDFLNIHFNVKSMEWNSIHLASRANCYYH